MQDELILQRLAQPLPGALKHIREAYGAMLRGTLAGAITVGLWAGMVSLAAPAASAAKPVDIVLALAIDGPAWRVLA